MTSNLTADERRAIDSLGREWRNMTVEARNHWVIMYGDLPGRLLAELERSEARDQAFRERLSRIVVQITEGLRLISNPNGLTAGDHEIRTARSLLEGIVAEIALARHAEPAHE